MYPLASIMTRNPRVSDLLLILYDIMALTSHKNLTSILQDDGTPDEYDLPAPSADGAVPISQPPDGKSKMPNGHMNEDEAERYVKQTGWAPRFGQGSITSEEAQESLLDPATLLESQLDDKFFGGKLLPT